MKKKDGVLGMADLYEKYQAWCKTHQLAPFSSKLFGQIAKAEIETGFGLKYRHDLAENGGVRRGWKGLASQAALKLGLLPEIHVWVGLPDQNELLDFATKFLPDQAAQEGLIWRTAQAKHVARRDALLAFRPRPEQARQHLGLRS